MEDQLGFSSRGVKRRLEEASLDDDNSLIRGEVLPDNKSHRPSGRLRLEDIEVSSIGNSEDLLDYRPRGRPPRGQRQEVRKRKPTRRRRRTTQTGSGDEDEEVKSRGSAAAHMPLNFGATTETKPLPTFETILGPQADELEDKENPVQPDEEQCTRDNFCYICEAQVKSTFSLLQGAPVTDQIEFLVKVMAPSFWNKSIDVVIREIRDFFNRLIRPHMAPGFKQRWTRRQIFAHFFDHCKDYIGVLMKRACSDVMIKLIQTGISYESDNPRAERVNRDLVQGLLRLYNILKE